MSLRVPGAILASVNQYQDIPNAISRRKQLSVCMAAIIVGSAIIVAQDVNAAPKKTAKNKLQSTKAPSALEAEVARLQAQLEAVQRDRDVVASERDLLKQSITSGAAVGEAAPAAANDLSVPIPAETAPAEQLAQKEAAETDNLGEVVVRGKVRPRLEKVKDVPRSSSVRTGEELSRQVAQDLQAILQRAGNVRWNYGNSRTSSLSIRGVGQQAQTDAQDPSVLTVVDGVPYAYNPLTSFDHYDLDQIEVSRGPQGTNGGKNANMGVVRLNTRRPSFTPEASYSLVYGNYDTYIGDAAGGGSVIDDVLAWRGAIHVNKALGATTNEYNNRETWYNKDRVAGRVQLLFTPTENFNARISFDAQPRGEEYTNGATYYFPTPTKYANGAINALGTDAKTRLNRRWFKDLNTQYTYEDDYLKGNQRKTVNQDNQQPLITASKGGLVDLNWRVGDFNINSITAVRDYEFLARNDEGTPFDISKNGGGGVPSFVQISQELKVSSKIDKLVDYTAGIYLLDRDQIKDNAVGFGADAGAWFASTNQYNRLDTNSAGRQLMTDSLKELATNGPYYIHNQTGAIFAEAKWHITEPLSLTTGFRFSNENRHQQTEKYIVNNGTGANLNPGVVNGVNTGGFGSDANGNLTAAALADPNQVAIANAVAQKYFGVANYNVGLNDTQKAQVRDAKSIRAGSGIGVLWDKEPGKPYKSTQPGYVVSPSYKFNEDLTSYVSWQYAEKAGVSQTNNGVANLADPEKTNSYEIGLKSSFFDKTLTFNTDFFYTDITNYQQAVRIVDEYSTNIARQTNPVADPTYLSTTGNAKGVRALGVEIDGAYDGIPYTSISFSGSFNDAIYTDFKNLAKPVELNWPGSPAFYDATGERLPGASQFTFNIGPEVRFPLALVGVNVLGNSEFHTSFNTAYTSGSKSDISLSSYSYIAANTTTDFAIGIGRRDKLFDLSFIAKNLFNNQTYATQTWNSANPGQPQWFGVAIRGKI
ncbi:MAG: TonB-dependent receptor [Methylobacter sp.]|nr:MAG: TonB-dependent receptor [Methylobacter sp.]